MLLCRIELLLSLMTDASERSQDTADAMKYSRDIDISRGVNKKMRERDPVMKDYFFCHERTFAYNEQRE